MNRVSSYVRMGSKSGVPDAAVRVDQLVHGGHVRATVEVASGDLKITVPDMFEVENGTWTIGLTGTINTGSYTSGGNDSGSYTKVGDVCFCKFRCDGIITGLDLLERALINLPIPAIYPPQKPNQMYLYTGKMILLDGGGDYNIYAVTPVTGSYVGMWLDGARADTLGEIDLSSDGIYGHFWYFTA